MINLPRRKDIRMRASDRTTCRVHSLFSSSVSPFQECKKMCRNTKPGSLKAIECGASSACNSSTIISALSVTGISFIFSDFLTKVALFNTNLYQKANFVYDAIHTRFDNTAWTWLTGEPLFELFALIMLPFISCILHF